MTCPVPGCGRSADHGLCHACRDQLAARLRAIIEGPADAKGRPSPGLAEELRTTVARLDRISGGSLGVTSRDAERQLPWAEHASDALTALHHTLATWALLLHEESGATGPITCRDTPESIAAWLLRRHDRAAGHAAAGELVADIADVVTCATRAIDRAPDRYFAGPCATGECDADLYTRDLTGTITCRTCGAEHDAGGRRAWLRAHARDHLDTAPAIARALSVLCLDLLDGRTLSLARIRQWAARGQLARRGYLAPVGDRRPQPLYRVGDVERLLADTLTTRKAC